MAVLFATLARVGETRNSIKRLIAEKPVKFKQGITEAALLLQRESMKIVPIDTGNLRRSAETRDASEGTNIAILVVYSTDYAIYVHEDLNARHAEGKYAKFLERPARENLSRFIEIVIRRLRE